MSRSSMSRRSILLATTMCAAMVSLGTPDSVSAHGFSAGGFTGGQSGHTPQVSARGPAVGVLARAPSQPVHVATGGNSGPATAGMRFVHPQAVSSQAEGSSGFGGSHHPANARTIADITNNPTGPSAVAILAAHLVAEKAGQSAGIQNVAGPTGVVFGQRGQQSASTQSIPGLGSTSGGASQLNVPGSQGSQRQIPGLDGSAGPYGTGGASSLHTPGDNNDSNSVISVQQAIAKLVGDGSDLKNQATRGGINGLNVPSQQSMGTAAEDTTTTTNNKTNTTTTTTTPTSTTTTTTNSTTTTTTTTTDRSNATTTSDGSTAAASTAKAVIGVSDTASGPAAGQILGAVVSTALGAAGPVAFFSTGLGGNLAKLANPHKSGSDPDPTDSGTTTSTAGGLAPNSPLAQKNNGGGAGNNSETNGGKTSALATGSAYATRNHGDGGGNDAGDNNNRLGKDGALAAGGTLSHKDQGDGGGSDSRGGGGGTSIITNAAKPVNPGGGHNQKTGAATGTD